MPLRPMLLAPAGLALMLVFSPIPSRAEEPPPPTPPPAGSEPAPETPPEEPLQFEPPPPPPAIPEEFLNGRGYLGAFSEAWDTEKLLDPIYGKIFLALLDGADRPALEALEVPDLDLAIQEMVAGRLVRGAGGRLRPGFPVIRGEAGRPFLQLCDQAAAKAWDAIRPRMKKVAKLARKEKVTPWLFTLVWSEILESRADEEMLADAGALSANRLNDEGYLWYQVPPDRFLMGVDRYGTGSETLQYAWSPTSYLNPGVQDFQVRWRLVDNAMRGAAWEPAEDRAGLKDLGLVDDAGKVRVPLLRKDSRLLVALREAGQIYTRSLLASLRVETIASSLGLPRDEVFAAALGTTGFRVMARAVESGLVPHPEFFAREDSPMTHLVEALAITVDEGPHPMERANHLYDREDFNGALRESDQILAAHPDLEEARFRKAMSLMKLLRYEEALKVFEEMLARPASPDSLWRGWTLVRTGNALDMLQRRDEALVRYQQALGYANVAGSHDLARQWMEVPYQD